MKNMWSLLSHALGGAAVLFLAGAVLVTTNQVAFADPTPIPWVDCNSATGAVIVSGPTE